MKCILTTLIPSRLIRKAWCAMPTICREWACAIPPGPSGASVRRTSAGTRSSRHWRRYQPSKPHATGSTRGPERRSIRGVVNKRTKYAIHALLVLADATDGGPISAERIATDVHIPRKFLEAKLTDLAKAGIIHSRKGRGGHQLARKTRDIPMAGLLRLFDGAIALVPCVSLNFYAPCAQCPDERTCAVHDVFLEVRIATLRILQEATQADLQRRTARLGAGQ